MNKEIKEKTKNKNIMKKATKHLKLIKAHQNNITLSDMNLLDKFTEFEVPKIATPLELIRELDFSLLKKEKNANKCTYNYLLYLLYVL